MSNNIVQFNEEIIKGQIKELVRGSVEQRLLVSTFARWFALTFSIILNCSCVKLLHAAYP